MKLTGLHLLLSYQCTFECDHCFVFGSPWQVGVMTLPQIHEILAQGKTLGTVTSIYFEGGEPFLYYATLVKGVMAAAALGFKVGIVSNAYWATSLEDALEALRPLAGLVQDLTVSSDLFHYSEALSRQAQNASQAAAALGIPTGTISIAQPVEDACASSGQIPHGGSQVMYRGRAVEKLADKAPRHPWDSFSECPHEDLRDPGRVHVDPFGYLHICQGITIGNLFQEPLAEIVARFDPDRHPITGPLLRGGPAGLAREHGLQVTEGYVDACHLCYEARCLLRERFPTVLAPDGMYGVYG